jgi:feruloyl esterase
MIGRMSTTTACTVIAAMPVLLILLVASPATAASCESLAALTLPNAVISLATVVPKGRFVAPPEAQEHGIKTARFDDLPAFCRVAATLKPSHDSNIMFELWLPVSGWNEIFKGNWGLGGAAFHDEDGIGYFGLAAALRRGFAVAVTDTGRKGDSRYAVDHPEQIIDFGERSVHEMTVKAKALITAFYGRGPKFSYMAECGAGAIGALKEAQRHPDDYDGLVAGGGTAHLTRHSFAQMFMWQIAHKEPGSVIPPDKLKALHQAALLACDSRDGAKDGVIGDPLKCTFDPGVIQCQGADGPSCLTASQVEMARQMYRGPRNPRTGEQIFSPVYPGSELNWPAVTGPKAAGAGNEFFKYFVFKDPAYDYMAQPINFDSHVALGDRPDIQVVNAVDPDIRAYTRRGGKLIMYKGWNDAGVPPGQPVDYFNRVVKTIGAKAAEDAVRLYMVPGMNMCSGGDGADTVDWFATMRTWVEQKRPPADLVASRVVDGKTVRTRPLCAYPQVATYRGSGSTDEAANFVCR